ncbi:lysine--tRNA ligase [Methanobrevibacter oralis]|uniref:Lysine--tRNA ligase n=1 Tax=Methanobrevibacter oralis TaxID=66851 RepID=A0A166CFR2_METOA|nr:lysine--tRNA ligase [Methanobrevibacter oralis]KZX13897.1 lysine--tRNA ligase [Methanobrevibacter oralis]
MKHWIEKIAEELNERNIEKHVIASGTSISGSIHIGNSCDVFIANAIGKKLRELGDDAETIWIADDHDPLRKVPFPLPEDYEKYLGMPYSTIPCPDGCCSNFVEHFEKPFLRVMKDYKIDIKTKSGFEMYKSGIYNDYIRIALEKTPQIKEIFNKYRREALADNWLPYNPICEECGRVNTTYAYDYDGDNIKYRCECGHKGEMDIKSGNGKLTWRVEWAARWKIFGVTCEPFGKDHAASGGSYDVSSVISEEIFNYEAPYPVPYEWITLDGEAMSKSHGVFFTPEEWLKIGPAESLNYYLFRSKPMKAKDFSPKMSFLDFMDQFDKVEKVFYDEEKAPSEKEGKKFKKIYEVSQINIGSPLPFRPPYRFLVNAYQIAGNNLEKIFNILKNNSQLTKSFENKNFDDLNENELAQFEERVNNVSYWLDTYAPKFVKFQVQEKNIPKLPLTDEQTQFLNDLANLIETTNYNKAEDLHDAMYEILEEQGLKPQKGFQAIYKMILGQKQGPRAASFLLSLDKDFVVKRLRRKA